MVFAGPSSPASIDSDTKIVGKTGSCPLLPRMVFAGPSSPASTNSDTKSGGMVSSSFLFAGPSSPASTDSDNTSAGMMEDPADSIKGKANEVEIEIPSVSGAIHDHPTPPRPYDLVCAFSKLENDEAASNRRLKSLTKLCGLMILYMTVTFVDVVGGIQANSLAVLADAGHLLAHIFGLSFSLFAV
ncbi:hypothetical protein EUGRSUZ_B02299 [Eucalyptus grandis]|uniref:Uncharacterized protein n=2 Tax=Eucalyptus grandis TaxID=71139 RepID=A0A059D4V6_EUCGR|nr:hypothetical protein EUGRSUZ_B02299 [Eucalyptus grandis]